MSVESIAIPSPTLLMALRQIIRKGGPISIARYMAACLYDPRQGYYATRSAIGAEGDFITAPEVSQMFGELIGLWAVQMWTDMGCPKDFQLIELGPGNGTLMADILRAARIAPDFLNSTCVTLVEMSNPLRAEQARKLNGLGVKLAWADSLREATPGPSLILGNEFLDCLPIRQFVREGGGWRERLVGLDLDQLVFCLAPERQTSDALIPEALRNAPEGSLVEIRPQAEAVMQDIGRRFRDHPGAALFIDYGPAQSEVGDTLQAVLQHKKVAALETPGFADLTARVDFAELIRAGVEAGLYAHGPETQGRFLRSLGLDIRAANLITRNPDKGSEIVRAKDRLASADEMGELFKAVCFTAQGVGTPPGF